MTGEKRGLSSPVRAGVLLLLVAFLAAGALPASLAQSYTLTAQTSSSTYYGSQTVTVSGVVTPAPTSSTEAGIKVSNPSGTTVYVGDAPVSTSTGDYSLSFTAGGTNWVPGSYTVTVTWAPSATSSPYTATATFEYYTLGFSVSVSPSTLLVHQSSYNSTVVTVTLISGSGTVDLSASGLPSGASAVFSPSSGSPTFTSTLTVTASSSTPTGTYAVTITGSGGGTSASTTLTLVVEAPIPVKTYSVTFDETGLPSGTTWAATLNGVTKSSSTSSIQFTGIAAGTYAWNVTKSVTVSGKTYAASPYSGAIDVPTQTSVSVTYSPVIPYNFSVSVSPSSFALSPGMGAAADVVVSLTQGTAHPVVLTAQAPSGFTVGFERCGGNMTSGSFSTSMALVVGQSVAPGTYAITVTAASDGVSHQASLQVTVALVKPPTVKYNVTIAEVGLPSGTTWAATLNGVTKTTSGSYVTFTGLTAGTYAWNVTATVQGTATRYVASVASG
ncbi:MAG: hypothetical protein RAK18_05475, partial [Conexivisphaerales archaeon]|nr:hypothetical protein [Conexivisphaerales archaeon]